MPLIKEMLFTARSVSAARLGSCGVVNDVVPAGELADTVATITDAIVSTSPLVNRILKEELRVLSNAHPLTPEAHERIQLLRREAYDWDYYQEASEPSRRSGARTSAPPNPTGRPSDRRVGPGPP